MLFPSWHLNTQYLTTRADGFSEESLVITQFTRIQKQKQNDLDFWRKIPTPGIIQWNTQFRLLHRGLTTKNYLLLRSCKGQKWSWLSSHFKHYGKNSSGYVLLGVTTEAQRQTADHRDQLLEASMCCAAWLKEFSIISFKVILLKTEQILNI